MAVARRAVVAFALVIVAAACSGGDREEQSSPTTAPSAITTGVVADGKSEGCPEDRLWTDCPAAAWVARVAERAGFVVTGETQSALTVEGDGPSFYFWATPLTAPADELAADEGWRTLGRSAGVDVYGDPGLWQWWTVQEQILWVNAGPTEDARLPTLAELAPLIRASRELAAPPAR